MQLQPGRVHRHVQRRPAPLGGLLLHVIRREVHIHRVVDRRGDVIKDQLGDLLAFEHVLADAVELVALVLHHLVVFEQVLADLVVAFFDLALGAADGPRHHAVLDGVAFFHAQLREQDLGLVAGEHLHQVVFQREEETRRALVALPAGAATQLVVDPTRLVPLGTDDVQPAHLLDVVPQLQPVPAVVRQAIQLGQAVVHRQVGHLLLFDEGVLLAPMPQ